MNKYMIAVGSAVALGLSGLGVGAAVAATVPPTTPPSSFTTPAATLNVDADITGTSEANEPKETTAEQAADAAEDKNEPKETAAQQKADAAKDTRDASDSSGSDSRGTSSPIPSTTP